MVLQSFGYQVLMARDGQAAVSVAEQHPGTIHLLLTDMLMPRMSGRQLADRMTATRRGLRVLFMSGYTEDSMLHPGASDPGVGFIAKPFSPPALTRKVRELLDADLRV